VYLDRLKDSMRRRGENISSFEVERSVNAHPAVLETAAYPIPSEVTEDEVMVAVVLKPGLTVDPAELLAFCAKTMPRFAVPRYVRFVDELPKTPTARVRKHELRDQGITADTADREALGIVVTRN
jgi:crotonobetaine/carnitine-CoA ligase